MPRLARVSILTILILTGQVAAAVVCEATCASRAAGIAHQSREPSSPALAGCHSEIRSASAPAQLAAGYVSHCAHAAGAEARLADRLVVGPRAAPASLAAALGSTITHAHHRSPAARPSVSPPGSQVPIVALRI